MSNDMYMYFDRLVFYVKKRHWKARKPKNNGFVFLYQRHWKTKKPDENFTAKMYIFSTNMVTQVFSKVNR